MGCLGFSTDADGEEQNKPVSTVSASSEVKWSLLPDLLLLMIRDKLDVFDDMRLSAVCRDWRVVSAQYPKQCVGDGMPWVMHCDYISSTVRDFISVEGNKKFRVDMPEFGSARLLCSRQGWILFRQSQCTGWCMMSYCFVLVNPITKSTIKMPHLDFNDSDSCFGCFSTHEGYPRCVAVLLIDRLANKFTIQTAFPGDQEWMAHSYIPQSFRFKWGNGFLAIGQNIHCFDREGNMVIFNKTTQMWKEVPSCSSTSIACHIVELEGQLLQLVQKNRYTYSYMVFRYNDTNTLWESLKYDDVKEISWFVMKEANCYISRKQSLKAYILPSNLSDDKSCFVHDLADRTTTEVGLCQSIIGAASWVDIG